MDPTDPKVLYVGEIDSDDAGGWVHKSLDGGASWSYTGLPYAGVNALVIDPANPTTLYAGTNEANPIDIDGLRISGGLLKSADGGVSWSGTGLMNTTIGLLAIDPAHTNILYALTNDVRGPFKSLDSGASWSPVNNGLGGLSDTGARMTALVIDPDDSNILYVGTTGGGVFRSIDGGANWGAFNDGLTNLDVSVLAIATGNPSAIYAATAGGVFAITSDSITRSDTTRRARQAPRASRTAPTAAPTSTHPASRHPAARGPS